MGPCTTGKFSCLCVFVGLTFPCLYLILDNCIFIRVDSLRESEGEKGKGEGALQGCDGRLGGDARAAEKENSGVMIIGFIHI